MNNPPRILGIRHSALMAIFGLYVLLACAPSSKYEDPTTGKELSQADVSAELNKAMNAPSEEALYQIGDKALLTEYIKYFSQIIPKKHWAREITSKDGCYAYGVETDQDKNLPTLYKYALQKPGCNYTQSVNSLEAQGVSRMMELRSTLSLNADPALPPEATFHYYSLTVVRHTMKVPNCVQYPDCIAHFTRLEYDAIINPADKEKRERYHHVWEISTEVPRIISVFSHCIAYLAINDVGDKVPVNYCMDVDSFLVGQVAKPTPTPSPSASVSPGASPAASATPAPSASP